MKKHMKAGVAIALVLALLVACGPAAGQAGGYTVDKDAQALELTSVKNARELGGYPAADGTTVKTGVLLRTGALGGLTEADMAALAEAYSLQHVIDLRAPSETEAHPNPAIGGAVNHLLPIYDDLTALQLVLNRMTEEEFYSLLDDPLPVLPKYNLCSEDLYAHIVTDPVSVGQYKQMFEILLENEGGAVLFHCASGKDRTGVAAMLILAALGVEKDVIFQDYLLTNAFNAAGIEAMRAMLAGQTDDEALIESSAGLGDGVLEPWLESSYAAIEADYGSMDSYLEQALGLTPEKLARLRELYTE